MIWEHYIQHVFELCQNVAKLIFTEGSTSSEIPHLWFLGVHHLSHSYVTHICSTPIWGTSHEFSTLQIRMRLLLLLFLVSVFHKRWSDAEHQCRLDGSPVRLTRLLRTFINRGAWNVIPGLVHSSGLVASKFCLCFSFSGSLSVSLHQCLWNPSSPAPVTGQAACFHNRVFKMASLFPEPYFQSRCSETMRKGRIRLTCGVALTIKRVQHQIYLESPWMKCWWKANYYG